MNDGMSERNILAWATNPLGHDQVSYFWPKTLYVV